MFRLASEKDIEQIATIYEHIHDAEEAKNAVVGWNRNIYPTYQTAVKGIAKHEMFVEEIDGMIVAAGRINKEQVKEYENASWLYEADADEVMVLHTLVVDPQIKGKGFGSAFVVFYEEYAISKGCHVLRIDTQEKNIVAREFYKKLGFKEAGVVACDFNGISDVNLVCLEKRI